MREKWHHRLDLYLDLIRWNRPAGWLLLLWPTLSALWIAAGGKVCQGIPAPFGKGRIRSGLDLFNLFMCSSLIAVVRKVQCQR